MKTIRILFIAAGLAGFAGSSVAQIHPRLDNNWTITPGGASNIAVALESIHAGGGGASFTNLSAGTPLYISVTNSNGGTNGLISITADNLNAIKGWLLTNDIITLTFVTGAFQQTTNDFNSIFGKLASPNSWLAPQTFTSVVMQTTYQQVTQIVTVTNGVSPIYITGAIGNSYIGVGVSDPSLYLTTNDLIYVDYTGEWYQPASFGENVINLSNPPTVQSEFSIVPLKKAYIYTQTNTAAIVFATGSQTVPFLNSYAQIAALGFITNAPAPLSGTNIIVNPDGTINLSPAFASSVVINLTISSASGSWSNAGTAQWPKWTNSTVFILQGATNAAVFSLALNGSTNKYNASLSSGPDSGGNEWWTQRERVKYAYDDTHGMMTLISGSGKGFSGFVGANLLNQTNGIRWITVNSNGIVYIGANAPQPVNGFTQEWHTVSETSIFSPTVASSNHVFLLADGTRATQSTAALTASAVTNAANQVSSNFVFTGGSVTGTGPVLNASAPTSVQVTNALAGQTLPTVAGQNITNSNATTIFGSGAIPAIYLPPSTSYSLYQTVPVTSAVSAVTINIPTSRYVRITGLMDFAITESFVNGNNFYFRANGDTTVGNYSQVYSSSGQGMTYSTVVGGGSWFNAGYWNPGNWATTNGMPISFILDIQPCNAAPFAGQNWLLGGVDIVFSAWGRNGNYTQATNGANYYCTGSLHYRGSILSNLWLSNGYTKNYSTNSLFQVWVSP